MAISRTIRRLSITAFACAALSGQAWAEETELAITDVPAAVLATMQKSAAGAKLAEFERETEKGKTVYTATFDGKDGKEMEVTVNPDGTLVSVELEKDEKKGAEEKGKKEGKDDKEEKGQHKN